MVEIFKPGCIDSKKLKEKVSELEEKIWKRSDLSLAEKQWLLNYVNNIARKFAYNPDEPVTESKDEELILKAVMLENLDHLVDYAKRWRKKLVEFFLS